MGFGETHCERSRRSPQSGKTPETRSWVWIPAIPGILWLTGWYKWRPPLPQVSVAIEVQSVASPRGGEGQSIRRSRNFLPSIFFSVNKTFIKTSFSLLYYPVILKLTICVNMLTIIKKIIDLFIVLQSPPYIICPQHKGQYPNWWWTRLLFRSLSALNPRLDSTRGT